MAFEQVIGYNPPDGAVFGKDTSAKIGFYGTAPIAQRSGSTQAALTLTTALTAGFGFTTATGFSTAVALLVEMRAAMVALGLIKGSA